MKNMILILALAASGLNAGAQNEQSIVYMQNGCAEVLENLVLEELATNPELLSNYGYSSFSQKELNSLGFASVKDLDQGSWDIQREVTFKMWINAGSNQAQGDATLTVRTRGDIFCDNETLESIESFIVIWDI